MFIAKKIVSIFLCKFFTCMREVEEDPLKSEFSSVCYKTSVLRKSISMKVIKFWKNLVSLGTETVLAYYIKPLKTSSDFCHSPVIFLCWSPGRELHIYQSIQITAAREGHLPFLLFFFCHLTLKAVTGFLSLGALYEISIFSFSGAYLLLSLCIQVPYFMKRNYTGFRKWLIF